MTLIEMLHGYNLLVLKNGVNNMDTDLCKIAKKILERVASDIFVIEDNSYYLWLYRHDGDMVGIVHGGGSINKPYEFKVINVGDYKQKDFKFHNWCDFKDFLENDMRSIVLAMAL